MALAHDVFAPPPARVSRAEENFTVEAESARAQKIEAYWRARGKTVTIRMIAAPFSHTMRCARWDIRSDMLNGMPRKVKP